MKLRNKRTGEIIEGKCFTDIVKKLHERGDVLCYDSLLNVGLFTEYWKEIDSYEPKEPLIKDEKIRKAVRAWAEANRTKYVWVSTALKGIDITQDFEHLQLTEYKQNITFECEAYFESGNYTINELCGEEEE